MFLMAITAQCACGKTISARDELSGRRVKCPSCQQSITIPETNAASQKAAAIATTCGCGKSFHAKPDLAGKTVKCPGCAQPVTIPAGLVSASGAGQSHAGARTEGVDVECPCGKAIKAPLKLAGRTVRCPACNSPLAIPDPTKGPIDERDENAAADDFGLGNELAGIERMKDLHGQGIDDDISGMAGLLDELGLEASKTGLRCPSCRSDIAQEAILCTNCGYNLETGKQLKLGSFVKDNGKTAKIGAPNKKKDRKGFLGLFEKK